MRRGMMVEEESGHRGEPIVQGQNRAGGGLQASAVAPSQAIPIVGVPSYPNCIKWSEENLLAVGAGHLVTILNPASMAGPRGFIPITTSPLFNVGTVQPKDLQAHSLLQFCLARDPRPGVRSIDWSPPGLAQNGGCLLAVCTTDNRVKVYRSPFCDFQAEWIEVVDLSAMVFNYCLDNDFIEADIAAAQLVLEEEAISPPLQWGFRVKRKLTDDEEPQHRKVQKMRPNMTGKLVGAMDLAVAPPALELPPVVGFDQEAVQNAAGAASSDVDIFSGAIEKGSRVEVWEEDNDIQYWVGASVVEITSNEALVRLDEPQSGVMQQWVPLHDQQALADYPDIGREKKNSYLVDSTCQRNGEQVMQVRPPRIRPLVVMDTLETGILDEDGGKRLLACGEFVEAWVNFRWQAGMVIGLRDCEVVVKFSDSCTESVVERSKLRLAPCWQGKRWVWENTSAESIHKRPRASCSRDDSRFPTAVENNGQELPIDSREELHTGQSVCLIQNLGSNFKSGQDRTSLTLDLEQTNSPLPGPEQDSPYDLNEDTEEECYSRVYKRRGLATTAGLPVAISHPGTLPSPSDALNTEIFSTRPARNRRPPSKFRNEDMITWMTEADGSASLGNDGECKGQLQEKGMDYVEERVIKYLGTSKLENFAKDAQKVNQVKNVEAMSVLKDVKDKLHDTTKQESKMSDVKDRWISASDFAARTDMLSPLALAWSLKYEERGVDGGDQGEAQKFVLLAAGMKSGRVSLWRMACPSIYTIKHHIPVSVSFLGFLYAHEAWVTSLSWASCFDFDLMKLNPLACKGASAVETLLLATGCSDGSVKLWAGLPSDLSGPSFVNRSVPFVCLRQVIEVDSFPVTSLALITPPQPGDRTLLAVGKGSGSVAVWELVSAGDFCPISSRLVAHQQMVTGFSWTYDGRCLYSCGQDSLKCWDISQDRLLPLPFPDSSNVFPPNTSPDLCSLEALESFFGVTLSHNGLALAVVRGIASDLLDQMYQARSQKGMVQLFWLGSEHLDFNKYHAALTPDVGQAPNALSGHDKFCWELNIVAALEHLQDTRQTLVLWDVVTALSSLKKKIGVKGLLSILSKWLSRWGAGAIGGVDPNERSSGSFRKIIPEASCRKLQMLNVIYRRLFLSNITADGLNAHSVEKLSSSIDEDMDLKVWKDRVHLVEHDLRQRLVHLSLRNATCKGENLEDSEQGGDFVATELHVKWVLDNVPSMFPQLVKVANKLSKSKSNLLVNLGASHAMEACTFCDSAVPFESPEIASCGISDNMVGVPNCKHHLQRCAISMQVCPPACLWHCSCCARSAFKQASSFYFSLSSRAQISELTLPLPGNGDEFPCCPFCGILMHCLLPNFFLTPSLV